MKKVMLLLISWLAMSSQAFTDQVVLENQTPYPKEKIQSRIAVQWASTAREVEEGNQAMIYGWKLNLGTLQDVEQAGKVTLNAPKKAQYFRILVWSKGDGSPDLLTNWVDIVPDKTYTLKEDHLIPVVLMAGTGC